MRSLECSRYHLWHFSLYLCSSCSFYVLSLLAQCDLAPLLYTTLHHMDRLSWPLLSLATSLFTNPNNVNICLCVCVYLVIFSSVVDIYLDCSQHTWAVIVICDSCVTFTISPCAGSCFLSEELHVQDLKSSSGICLFFLFFLSNILTYDAILPLLWSKD